MASLEPAAITWKVGDRVSWTNAPSWWNPQGEEIIKIVGNKASINYWASAVEISQLFSPQ